MTIKELAEQLNVSPRTIYRRADKSGVSITDLREEDGQLKPEAYQILAALFDNVGHDATRDNDVTVNDMTETKRPTSATNDTRVTELMAELAHARGKIEGLERENELLRQMVEKTERVAAEWKEQADRAQQIQVMQMGLIPERVGTWQRLKNMFKGKTEEQSR